MGFIPAVKSFFIRYTDFSGRSSRSEYWWVVLLNILVAIILSGIGLEILGTLYALTVLIPGIALFVRRLHDTNKSAWYILMGLIPVAGVILYFIYMVAPSQAGGNQYGEPSTVTPETI